MNKDAILDAYELNVSALKPYGFCESRNGYTYQQECNKTLYLKIEINDQRFRVNVYDKELNEEYIPFQLSSASGNFVTEIRKKVGIVVQDIIETCMTPIGLRNEIFSHMKEAYQVEPEYPWDNQPTYAVFKIPESKKWFALMMRIPYRYLGMKKEGVIDVINLKVRPETIESLIDHESFFPAYHMNKKYWITVMLNQRVSFEKVINLIEESYLLVKKK